MRSLFSGESVRNFPPSVSTATGTVALCVAFSAVYALGMPGYDVPGLPFVCLVPLLGLSDHSATARQAARRGLFAGTLANLLLVYWVAYTVAVQGKLGWAMGGIAALLVSIYMGVYISLAAAVIQRLRGRFGAPGLWAFPAVWVCLEYARSVLFTGFPWLLLGYSLSGHFLFRQAADLAGVYGLGFLLAAENVCLYLAGSMAARGERRGAFFHLAGAAAVAGFLFAYGAFRTAPDAPVAIGESVRVGVAQGGIDQSVKWDPSYQKETIGIYRALTREAKEKGAEVVVWPETAAPFFYGWETEMSAAVDSVAAENRVTILFGAPWFDPSKGGKYYNSVFLLEEGGIAKGRYDKRHLVPFGEYIPLRSLLFFLRKLTVGEEDFSAGDSPALFPVRGEPVGASVCYEAIFPGIIRESVREGARWLVNVTNDAWFGDTVAPHQHLAMARMRSVEYRRTMVRAANSGISAIIDERGEVSAGMGLFRNGTIVAEIHPRSERTTYAKTGEIFAILCTIITILILSVSGRGTDGRRSFGRKNRLA
ncbi:MAG TPA: apolipoprotein N-acyltransferase [Candidatus Deferrimicrobiaceae bacterium]|nr:apolipoprotein N-acyltransferase [Candidatus Deferrimicrobiaceae bacterium]